MYKSESIKRLFVSLLLFILIPLMAETVVLNNLNYEKIDGQWYLIAENFQFKVDDNTISVLFSTNITESEQLIYIQSTGCEVLHKNILDIYNLEIPQYSNPIEMASIYLNSGLVQIAEPNTELLPTSDPDDPYYDDQWYLSEENPNDDSYGIDASKAWDIETGDPDVVIAVLDYGTDIFHNDLNSNIWVNPGEDLDGDGVVWDLDDMNGVDDDDNNLPDDLVGWNFYESSNIVVDENHGSMVAGIVGAGTNNILGISGIAGGWGSENPGCKMLIGVIGSIDALVNAITYAASKDVNVITLSTRCSPSDFIPIALDYAYNEKNCFISLSSCNQDTLITAPYPWTIYFFLQLQDYVFNVGAIMQDGTRRPASAYGDGLQVVAPGEGIYSTHNNNLYSYESGTSCSSPQVGAVAGLIFSRHPDFTNDQVGKVICLTAQKLDSYDFNEQKEYGSWNNEVGYGKLNAHRALGITGDITSNLELVEGNYIFGEEVRVVEGVSLQLADDSRFYLLEQSKLIIEEGATLVVGDNVIIMGECQTIPADEFNPEIPGNRIEVYGDVVVGDNATFGILNDEYWDGLYLYDCGTVSITNPTFENCDLYAEDTELVINEGTFTNSRIDEYRRDIELYNVDFENSFIYANGISNTPLQQSTLASIENCTINNTINGTAIFITTYTDFELINNSISCNGIGIDIYESGNGRSHSLMGNQVSGTSNGYGILLYHTYADLTGYNNVHDKSVGIVGYHNCELTILGDLNAPYQIIRNNIRDELSFSHDSFPTVFHNNKIYDSNHEYYLLKCIDHGYSGPTLPHDVTYNYWGTIFNPALDFYPMNAFLYNPQWNPGGGTKGDDELLYDQAKQYEDEENYDLANLTYKTVIETYPESIFSKASVKELFALEKKIGTSRSFSDFAALKQYYETEPNMSYDLDMHNLSEDLINYCNLELENFATSIGYCENIIANPPTNADSVFAVIDAGYTYLLMENLNRSNFVGQNALLKSKSRKDFELSRNQLLSDLLGDSNENIENIVSSRVFLKSNYPNPFNPTTTISFSIPNEDKIELAIFNIKGQKVKTLINTELDKGSHSVVWNGVDDSGKIVSSGVYFYKLSVGGKSKAVKKCLMIK